MVAYSDGVTAGPNAERRLPGSAERLLSLEALRGVLAGVVFLHHFVLSFVPAWSGNYAATFGTTGLDGSPLFVLINGRAAVMCFCVLSGFVLTREALRSGQPGVLMEGALKRWPRLAGPALLSVVLSLALFGAGAYRFVAAGEASASPWLAAFGDAYKVVPDFVPSIGSALRSGLLDAFVSGTVPFNVPLWTMQVELLGGWIAFVVAGLLLRMPAARRRLVYVFAGALALVSPWVGAFPVGVLLAWALRARTPRLGGAWAVGAALVALYLLGDGSGTGAYAWLGAVQREYVVMIGAALLCWVFVSNPQVRGALGGPWSAWLGQISFPLYLVHMPVIGSVGSWVYLGLSDLGVPEVVVLGVTLVATLAACAPLVYVFSAFDRWWVRRISMGAARVLRAFGPRMAGGEALPARQAA